MKRMILDLGIIFFLVLCLVIVSSPFTSEKIYADAEETTLSAMIQRAEEIVNYTWTPSQKIYTWNANKYNGKTYFPAGEEVKGVPYTLFTTEVVSDSLLTLKQYKAKASSNYSTTAYCTSVSETRTGPVYGSCCAGFICEVFGGSWMNSNGNPVTDSVNGLRSSSFGTTTYNIKMSDIKAGDAVSSKNGVSHVIWVASVTDTKLVIYEQTPPVARKKTINKSDCTDSNGNFVYCDHIYDVITRSKGFSADTKPTAPTNVQWTDQSSPTPNSVTISWDKVSGATSYNVYRRRKVAGITTEYGDPIKTGITGTSYTDTGLETAAMYYYKIVAVNSAGSSAKSEPALRVWTMSKAPTCTTVSSTSIKLSWDSVEFAETYRIDRRVAQSGTKYSTVTTGLTTTSFTDTGLDPDTEYYYRVYPVASSTNDNITVRSETSAKARTKAKYYLNLNGYLGTNSTSGNISGYGTADIYINGSLEANDVTDYYVQWDEGTAYEIKDIKTSSGKYYYGVSSGSLTGTLTKDTVVQLHYGTLCSGTQTVADGTYVIASAMDKNKVFDVEGAGTDNAVNLQLSTYKGLKSQTFTIKYQGNGYYSITDVNSGLSIHAQGSGTTDGTNAHMWNSATGVNGRWVIKDAGNGYYNIITHCSSMYLDVADASTADGTNIQIYTGNGTNAQKFSLIPYYYAVSYNANGGSGVPGTQNKIYKKNLTLSGTKPAREGYMFAGWAVTAGAENAEYQPGDSYTEDAAVTFYAVWIKYDYILPASLVTIESQAFAGIPAGSVVYIPSTVEGIASNAFNKDVIIVAPAGSYAAQWADNNGFVYFEE